MSDCECDCKTRAGTYQLEVEAEGDMSDHRCNYRQSAGMTYRLGVQRKYDMSDSDCDYNTRTGITYGLKMERQDDSSDCSWDDKIKAETYSLEGVRVACQITVVTTSSEGREHTAWGCRGRVKCKIAGGTTT